MRVICDRRQSDLECDVEPHGFLSKPEPLTLLIFMNEVSAAAERKVVEPRLSRSDAGELEEMTQLISDPDTDGSGPHVSRSFVNLEHF